MTKSINALAAQAVENPEVLATLGEAEIRSVMGTLTLLAAAAHARWLTVLETEQASKHASSDRLLSIKEIASRVGCSKATLARGRKSGQYPFILKDGRRLVGSEAGLERWIKSRTDRKFSRN
jgi:predicted DNA-binding transcriptional regulator AlpA